MFVLCNREDPPQVFHLPSGTRTIVENAMQSCLQISTLCSEKIAKARILRARARLAAGLQFSANEGVLSPLPDVVLLPIIRIFPRLGSGANRRAGQPRSNGTPSPSICSCREGTCLTSSDSFLLFKGYLRTASVSPPQE
jgi:hypothetical protein